MAYSRTNSPSDTAFCTLNISAPLTTATFCTPMHGMPLRDQSACFVLSTMKAFLVTFLFHTTSHTKYKHQTSAPLTDFLGTHSKLLGEMKYFNYCFIKLGIRKQELERTLCSFSQFFPVMLIIVSSYNVN